MLYRKFNLMKMSHRFFHQTSESLENFCKNLKTSLSSLRKDSNFYGVNHHWRNSFIVIFVFFYLTVEAFVVNANHSRWWRSNRQLIFILGWSRTQHEHSRNEEKNILKFNSNSVKLLLFHMYPKEYRHSDIKCKQKLIIRS